MEFVGFNPCDAETRAFHEKRVNSMSTDALALVIARTSAAMVLIV